MGEKFWSIDWHGVFVPTTSLLELIVRGTLMYLVLFTFLRIVLKRQTAGIGTADILVVVLIAEFAGRAFSTDYSSVVEGLVLVCTVLFWSYAIDWLAHRYPVVERLLHAHPLVLIEDGRMLRRNMRAELVTKEELMAHLRETGVEDCAQVKRAVMESDGRISVIKKGE